jgi:rRNA-processing protein FCF1
MATSSGRVRREKVVVDTGALLTALVLNFVRMIQVPKQQQQEILDKGIALYLRHTPRLQSAYLARFSGVVRPIRTTPHVIAEIHGLAKSRFGLHSQHLSSFWRHSITFLLTNGLDESLVRLVDLRDFNEVVCELGPIDSSIIHLAHMDGGVLLTTDTRLGGRARDRGVSVMSDYEFAHGAPFRS